MHIFTPFRLFPANNIYLRSYQRSVRQCTFEREWRSRRLRRVSTQLCFFFFKQQNKYVRDEMLDVLTYLCMEKNLEEERGNELGELRTLQRNAGTGKEKMRKNILQLLH